MEEEDEEGKQRTRVGQARQDGRIGALAVDDDLARLGVAQHDRHALAHRIEGQHLQHFVLDRPFACKSKHKTKQNTG